MPRPDSISPSRRPRLQRDVAVLAARHFGALGPQHLQGPAQARARVLRKDHLVYVAQLGSLVWVREGIPVALHQVLARLGAFLELAAEDDVDRALRTHHRD